MQDKSELQNALDLEVAVDMLLAQHPRNRKTNPTEDSALLDEEPLPLAAGLADFRATRCDAAMQWS